LHPAKEQLGGGAPAACGILCDDRHGGREHVGQLEIVETDQRGPAFSLSRLPLFELLEPRELAKHALTLLGSMPEIEMLSVEAEKLAA